MCTQIIHMKEHVLAPGEGGFNVCPRCWLLTPAALGNKLGGFKKLPMPVASLNQLNLNLWDGIFLKL